MAKGLSLKLGRLLALAAAVALVAAACGPAAAPAATPTKAPPAPTATTATTAAATPTATTTPLTPTPTARPQPTPTPTAIPPTPTPSVARPRSGGVLSYHSMRSFDPLDTYHLGGKYSIEWTLNILNGLLRSDPEGPSNVLPDLAERWEVSADGKVYTFYLRRGVQWHDGKPFTSKDAVFNLQRAWKPASPLLSAATIMMRHVTDIQAPDDYTVKITLRQPSASFLTGLAVPWFLMFPASIPNTPVDWKNIRTGTGPFKAVDYKMDISAKLVRNESYFAKDEAGTQLPYLDGINVTFMADYGLALSAFRTKRLDCYCGYAPIAPDLVDQVLKDVPDAKIYVVYQDAAHYFFNNKPPWNDLRVRKAVHLSLNFRDLTAATWGGKSRYPPTYLLGRGIGGKWAIPDDEMLKYPGYRDPKDQDIAESKRLLKEAGINPKDVKVTILWTHVLDLGRALASQLKAQGWDVDYKEFAQSPQMTPLYQAGAFDITWMGGGRGMDDPVDAFANFVGTGGAQNWGKWSDPEVDRLLDQQDSEVDPARREQLILQLQR